MTSTDDRPPACRSCRAPLLWAVTAAKGKAIPLDPDPHPDGNVELGRRVETADGRSAPLAHVVDRRQEALFEEPSTPARYLSHFATCPDADRYRKDKRQPSGAPARQVVPDPDPYSARHTDPETAHAAAAHAQATKGQKLERLEQALAARGPRGATADELTADLGEPIRNNVSRAILSLERQGRALRTDATRASWAGRQVIVYVHPDHAPNRQESHA